MAQKKILITDDENTGRQLLQAILLPENYTVILAENGSQAIDLARENYPDLILMDVMMPGMNGYKAVKSIRELPNCKATPIIMVTALDDRDSRIKGLQSGATDYIVKPFDRIEILTKIRNLTDLDMNKAATAKDNTNDKLLHQYKLILKEIATSIDIEKHKNRIKFYNNSDSERKKPSVLNINVEGITYLCLYSSKDSSHNSPIEEALIACWLRNIMNERPGCKEIAHDITSRISTGDAIKNTYWFIIVSQTKKQTYVCGYNQNIYISDENRNSKIRAFSFGTELSEITEHEINNSDKLFVFTHNTWKNESRIIELFSNLSAKPNETLEQANNEAGTHHIDLIEINLSS
ncbi:MAG: response regulator [Bacteroidales bacterium]|nr:response regulator [Bacteroidales bacterium]MBN2817879.1 response regulator [Bacteroidales bacterium]